MASRINFVAPAIVGTLLTLTLIAAAGVDLFHPPTGPISVFVTPDFDDGVVTIPLSEDAAAQIGQLIASAIAQTKTTTAYDPAYVKIEYPNGDVPIETGVCSDVVVRAFRNAGIDLQKEVHEDMGRAWARYPNKWGAAGRDKNIDHRRVGNLRTYFERQGKSRPIIRDRTQFQPGDIVSWDLGDKVDHIGIVVNVWNKQSERYLVVHNIGAGARMEDVLLNWEITGHYRYFPN